MKTHIVIALFVAPYVLLLLPIADGPAETVSFKSPAQVADDLAKEAILAHRVDDAMKWSQVALQIRASQYIEPIAELMSTYRDTIPNIPKFFDAASSVEEVTDITSWHHAKFASQAAKAIFRDNSPDGFRLALTKSAIWDLVRESTPENTRFGDKAPKTEQFMELFAWVDGGCQGNRTEFVTQVTSVPAVEAKLPRLVALLAPKKETAAK